MALNKEPYKGTRDFFPKQKRVQNYMFGKMKVAAESFGYEPYDGPLLEEVELYKAKSGEELINDQIYSFTDRGERFVAIRPEMTPTLARMVAQIHREESKPLRWYSIPNLMRYEKPQKGRLREHWQLNCDIFGAPGRFGEIEILQVAVNLMRSFGATSNDFEILLNDRSIVDLTFQKIMGLPKEVASKLYKIVDKSKKVPHAAVVEMVDKLGIEEKQKELFYSYLALKSFDELGAFLEKHNELAARDNFLSFISPLKEMGLLEYVKYDATIVRGLDYYTGIVFEIFDKDPENRRAICGGGAYANLLQIFNEQPLPGVGFGMGDVTLADFLRTHKLLPEGTENPVIDYFVTFQDEKAVARAFEIAAKLRAKGHKVVQHFEPLAFKKVFPLAEKKGAQFVVLIGGDELAKNVVQVKNLKTKTQETISINDL